MNKESKKTSRKNIICTSQCTDCIYSDIESIDKIKLKFHCRKKNKMYMYGQYVPCDFKEARDFQL